MSGHSKWSTIKRKKGAADAKRGQLFTRLGREITIAAREGGGDPEANFRLRLAVDKARAANMPKENIERAIMRGAGGGKESVALESVIYEGYGPGGTAFIVEVLTDNRNRAVAEVRRAFTRNGGNLGETGCVGWMFERKGTLTIDAAGQDADAIALAAIDAGAEDVTVDGDIVEVYATIEDFQSVRERLTAERFKVDDAALSWVPKTLFQPEHKVTIQNMRLIEALEELDDVQSVHSNLDISEAALAEFEAA
ncbi:MAG: YebC/PmpR family DNA-binding transcriptional regulator [Anaerolineae bacterium]|nr:YebC/PmpR family DNA-binding transcriptional regulator [Anaerolineae bacterium]